MWLLPLCLLGFAPYDISQLDYLLNISEFVILVNPATSFKSSPVGRVSRETRVLRSCMSVTKSETCAIIRVAHAGKVAAQSEAAAAAAAASCGSLVLLILQQPQSTVASHFSHFSTASGNDSLETFRPTLSCVHVRVRARAFPCPAWTSHHLALAQQGHLNVRQAAVSG